MTQVEIYLQLKRADHPDFRCSYDADDGDVARKEAIVALCHQAMSSELEVGEFDLLEPDGETVIDNSEWQSVWDAVELARAEGKLG